MTLAVLSVTLLLTALPVRIEAELCPSRQEIERSLVSLYPALPSTGPSDVAHVFRQGKMLRIELVDQHGVLIGGRSLDDSDHCAELAAQAAVVIASLASDVHPSFSLPAQDMPAAGPSKPAVPVPLDRPVLRSSFDLAAGVSLSYADTFAVGGSLAGLWVPWATGLGLRLSLGAEATRSVSLGPGKRATWARRTATTEADWRYGRGPWTVDVHAGLAWTLLHADGSGFSSNASDDSFSPGMVAGVRLSWWPTGTTAVWFGLDATTWLVRQSVTDAPGTAEHQIPGSSVMAGVGVALGRSSNRSLGFAGQGAL